MAQIGCLGDVLFKVSSDVVRTADNIQWSGSARYAEHQRHLNNALTEYAGIDADRMSFEVQLLAELGVDATEELAKIWAYERKGTALPLVFGSKGYGKHRWTIKSHRVKMEYFDSEGNLSGADVSIDLLEYTNE